MPLLRSGHDYTADKQPLGENAFLTLRSGRKVERNTILHHPPNITPQHHPPSTWTFSSSELAPCMDDMYIHHKYTVRSIVDTFTERFIQISQVKDYFTSSLKSMNDGEVCCCRCLEQLLSFSSSSGCLNGNRDDFLVVNFINNQTLGEETGWNVGEDELRYVRHRELAHNPEKYAGLLKEKYTVVEVHLSPIKVQPVSDIFMDRITGCFNNKSLTHHIAFEDAQWVDDEVKWIDMDNGWCEKGIDPVHFQKHVVEDHPFCIEDFMKAGCAMDDIVDQMVHNEFCLMLILWAMAYRKCTGKPALFENVNEYTSQYLKYCAKRINELLDVWNDGVIGDIF
jgi:hypothetical protein